MAISYYTRNFFLDIPYYDIIYKTKYILTIGRGTNNHHRPDRFCHLRWGAVHFVQDKEYFHHDSSFTPSWTPSWTPSFLLTCSGVEQDTYSSEVGSFLWSSNLSNHFCIVETVLSQNISPQSVAFLTIANWFHFLRHLSKTGSLKSLENALLSHTIAQKGIF